MWQLKKFQYKSFIFNTAGLWSSRCSCFQNVHQQLHTSANICMVIQNISGSHHAQLPARQYSKPLDTLLISWSDSISASSSKAIKKITWCETGEVQQVRKCCNTIGALHQNFGNTSRIWKFDLPVIKGPIRRAKIFQLCVLGPTVCDKNFTTVKIIK